jgi:hypothetical protein
MAREAASSHRPAVSLIQESWAAATEPIDIDDGPVHASPVRPAINDW